MNKKTFKVKGRIKLFNAPGPWAHVLIPKEKVPRAEPRGWGSIPVMATIGKTIWRTSLFPLKKDNYFIPVKKEVRKRENIEIGDTIMVEYTPV